MERRRKPSKYLGLGWNSPWRQRPAWGERGVSRREIRQKDLRGKCPNVHFPVAVGKWMYSPRKDLPSVFPQREPWLRSVTGGVLKPTSNRTFKAFHIRKAPCERRDRVLGKPSSRLVCLLRTYFPAQAAGSGEGIRPMFSLDFNGICVIGMDCSAYHLQLFIRLVNPSAAKALAYGRSGNRGIHRQTQHRAAGRSVCGLHGNVGSPGPPKSANYGERNDQVRRWRPPVQPMLMLGTTYLGKRPP